MTTDYQLHFNSILVRLKHQTQQPQVDEVVEFQFYISAIKTKMTDGMNGAITCISILY